MKTPRRSKEQIAQLEAQIVDVLREDHPQSVRHVFYRLTDPRLPEPVEKSQAGYRQVQNRVTLMRKAGRLAYGWISDMTRRGFHVRTYANGGELIMAFASLYRVDLWQGAGVYVEIWVESRSIAGVIEDDCEELAVSLYPCGGFPSLTMVYEAAGEINRTLADSRCKRVIVLYVGDYDPAGMLIEDSARDALQGHLHKSLTLEFRRIAITRDQIDAYNLPAKPRKAGERRRLDIQETVEAESMPAKELRRILRNEIEAYLPAGALETTKAAEASERSGLYTLGAFTRRLGTEDAVRGLKRGVVMDDDDDDLGE